MARKERTEPPRELGPAVGAMIFASDEPVRPKQLADALGGVELKQIQKAIQDLDDHFEHSGIGLRLEWIAGGVRLATRPELATWVRQFFRQRNRTRLSLPALETLAIVAYRQPITAPEIQAIRGKDPSAALKGLLDKKLIRILGRKKVVGSPLLYGTANEFLYHFGLNNLEDLPSIEEFDQFLEVLEQRIEASGANAEEPPDVAADDPAEAAGPALEASEESGNA